MVWTPSESTGACLRTALPNGATYEEFSCLYPTIGKTYMEWEYPSAGAANVLNFMENNAWFPIATVVVYAISIYAGQKYMATREAWDWRKRLAAWNLFLAVFSFCGFARMAPHLLHNMYYYDFKTNLCTDPMIVAGFGPTSMWGLLFAWSKFFELIDTFFIIVRKKKLMFLHWYHHITVLLCCWQTIASGTPAGLIFSVVNFGVHSIMYSYYFLMAIKCRPKWFNPKLITVGQILQMVVGVGVCMRAYQYLGEESCQVNALNIRGTLFMYGSYLYLFSAFFFQRYIIKTKTKSA